MLSPPYVVVANHANFWDPFFLGYFLPAPLQFVTSDNIFRDWLFGTIMRLVGSIPKTKFMTDVGTIRAIENILSAGGAIGLFPEGRRSWDGRSIAIAPSTGKLLKRLQVPVISARIVGGYLVKPRWAAGLRRGSVSVELAPLLSPVELDRLSPQAINQRVQDAIEHDDVAYCDQSQRTFRSSRSAQWLERLLFICPHCEELDSLHSHGTILSCINCDFAVRHTDDGRLDPVVLFRTPGLRFDSVADWNRWQHDQLVEALVPVVPDIGTLPAPQAHTPIFYEARARLLTGRRGTRPQPVGRVELLLYFDRLHIRSGTEITIPLEQIEGVNIQNRERLEFFWHKRLYRIEFANRRACVYRWLLTLQILQSIRDRRGKPATFFDDANAIYIRAD